MINNYVLGFIFSQQLDKVFLVLKQRGPEINIGKLNGVGGSIEKDEHIYHAMERESLEETGQQFKGRWAKVGRILVADSEVHVFKTQANKHEGNLNEVNDSGEYQKWMDIHSVLTGQCISDIAENAKTMIVHSLHGEGSLSIKIGEQNV